MLLTAPLPVPHQSTFDLKGPFFSYSTNTAIQGVNPTHSTMPAPPGTNIHVTNQPNNAPWVEIIEQPSAKSTRFRYECEGRFAGSILGRTSSNEQKTFPAIKVHHHSGACVVVVSLVTHDDEKPKPHPHTLVGPECRQGVCTKKVKSNLDCIQFPNLGIQCKKKAELKEALTLRQQIRVDPFRTGFEHMEKPQLNNINLMVVKLCFQVFLPDETGKYQRPLQPVCSSAIHDKKSSAELSIHCYLPESCPINGREEMIILTGKLPKAEDLEVRFYEGQSDKPDWEGFGTFTQKDVHQSVALTIRIPEYTKPATRNKQQVLIQLRKKSNPQEVSQSRKFFYLAGESRSRHRPSNKRELSDPNPLQPKRIKNDPGYNQACGNGDDLRNQTPAVLDGFSLDSGGTVSSSFGSNGYAAQAPQPMYQTVPQLRQGPPTFYDHNQSAQYMPPHNMVEHQMQQPPISAVAPNGQDLMRVRVSDVNIYRDENSGKVFMAPGPTAANQYAPEVEIPEDLFAASELTIDQILESARNNPDSEIYIPSNLSENFNLMMNPTVDMLEGETIQSSTESQPHTTSLTKELKSMP